MNWKKKSMLIAIAAVLLVFLAALPWIVTTGSRSLRTTTYSQFLDQVHNGRVASVVIGARNSGAVEATYHLKDGEAVRAVLPSDYRDALRAMQDKLVNVEIRNTSAKPSQLLLNATPVFLLFAIWVVLIMWKVPNRLRQTHIH
jgi:ATP-dependent Zn protease